jgi:hypothetical protein
MIELKKGATRLDPSALTEILEIYRSVNENMMSFGEFPTQLADAFLIGCREKEKISIYVYFFLHEANKGLLFEETESLTPKNYAEKRREILESIEAMGFIMNNLGYRNLPPQEQKNLLTILSIFTGSGGEREEAEKKDPETILILEEEKQEEKQPSPKFDANLWGVLFRALASF